MTTNTSSRKACSLVATFVDTVRRNRSLLIFSFCLMLSAPIHILLEDADQAAALQRTFAVLELVAPIVLSIVVPFIVFHYLHTRRAVDLYHALPIKRSSLFLGKYLAGLTLVMAPTLLGDGSGWLLGRLLLGPEQNLSRYWIFMIEAVMIYNFVVFMVVCCGTVWETILYGCGMSLALGGVSTGISYLIERLEGYYYGYGMIGRWFHAFTPFYFFDSSYEAYSYAAPWYQAVIPVLMTIGVFCVSLLLYQNRKSENTGSAFAFRFLFHIISVFISVSAIISMCASAKELVSAAVVGILIYLVISLIANRGFKRLVPILIRCGAIVAVTCGFLLTFHATGGFGYETRIPAVEEIETAYIAPMTVGDMRELENGGNLLDLVATPASFSVSSFTRVELVASKESNGRTFGYQEKENLERIREIHQNAIDEANRDYLPQNIRIVYQLKNGMQVCRRYYGVSEESFEKLTELNAGAEYLTEKYPFMEDGYSYGENGVAAIVTPLYGYEEKAIYQCFYHAADEVAKALKADIAARPLGFEVAPEAEYLGRIALSSDPTMQEWDGMDSEQIHTVRIYACDKNILALLEQYGALDVLQNSVERQYGYNMLYITPVNTPTSNPYSDQVSGYSNKYGSQMCYEVSNDEDRLFLLKHLQPVYYSKEGCNIVYIGDYSYLLPNKYQAEFDAIMQRAESVNFG